jgi:hypothetical protein
MHKPACALLVVTLLITSGCHDVTPSPVSSIAFTTLSGACTCWGSSITLQINNSVVGTMACPGSSSQFSRSPGTYTGVACISGTNKCSNDVISLAPNTAFTVQLGCSRDNTITAQRRPLSN